jgi:hypothetical protein
MLRVVVDAVAARKRSLGAPRRACMSSMILAQERGLALAPMRRWLPGAHDESRRDRRRAAGECYATDTTAGGSAIEAEFLASRE